MNVKYQMFDNIIKYPFQVKMKKNNVLEKNYDKNQKGSKKVCVPENYKKNI